MKTFRLIPTMILVVVLTSGYGFGQRKTTSADNAALRYWAAFSQVQDSAISAQQGQDLNALLDGTAPFDDLKYRELVEKNKPALEIMARATTLPNCDWGLDYTMGEDVPVDYARKALVLGRLNVLYASHLLVNGEKDGAVRALASGLRFSQDVANGGSLFSAVISKDLLVLHLRAVAFALDKGQPSAAQRLQLQKAVTQLGTNALDWQTATKRDLDILRKHYSGDPQAAAAVMRIASKYIAALGDPSLLPALKEVVDGAPSQIGNMVPNPGRVLEQKQDLSNNLQRTRSLLQ